MLAIDFEFNRHTPKVSLISLDLTQSHAQDQVLSMLYHLRPLSIHLGLPCGTCSRARERALPANLRGKCKAPQPLRDENNLMGFPWLTGSNLAKVQSANQLYEFAIRLLMICWELGTIPSIENPTRSWLWGVLLHLVLATNNDRFIAWFKALHKTSFHACMHGSQRNKQTSLLAPDGVYNDLEAACDNNHPHLPWDIKPSGRGLTFATADEAAYPTVLCNRMASLLKTQAELHHVVLGKDISSTRQAKPRQVQQNPLFQSFHIFIIQTIFATLMDTSF